MKYIGEKVAYLKGLANGLGIDQSTKEGKVLDQIIEVLGEISDELDAINNSHDDLENYVEMIDEDLLELEDEVYELEMFEPEEDYYEVECPHCKDTFIVDWWMLDDDEPVICPYCDEEVEIEFDEHSCGDNCKCHDE